MAQSIFLIIFLSFQGILAFHIDTHSLYPYPRSEEEYMHGRDLTKEFEKEFEKRFVNLTQDEQVVDRYLGFLKWKEFMRTRKTGLPASMPMEKNLESVEATEIYKALYKLPKGGNLHSHEDHQLSKRKLFEIVWDSEDFEHLYIVDPKSNDTDRWMMDFFINPPTDKPWINVKQQNLTIDEVLKMNTLINLLTNESYSNPTSSTLRWNAINPLWLRASTQLISNIKIKKNYLEALINQSLSEGISYIESRRSFGLDMWLYKLNKSHNATHGKQFLDTDGELEVKVALDLEEKIRQRDPEFIGFKRISYTVRSLSDEVFTRVYNLTLNLHQRYPQHVIGFDAVAEEDEGKSSLYFIDQYLKMSDGKNGSIMPLYLHTAETSWPEDMKTSTLPGDLVSTLENAYDSLLLKSRRVGHGKGYIKKPFLRKLLKLTSTAVEICPLSNQILGMEPDLRNHYGQTYYKEGIPIVLAPDDPGTFGFDNVTYDWYAAFTGWGLNLGDLKKIAHNSLEYTGMNKTEKESALTIWKTTWHKYISELKDTACSRDFVKEALNESRFLNFTRVLPSYAHNGTKIHIYGQNFERGVCFGASFKLGNISQVITGTYLSNQELYMEVPDLNNTVKDLEIYVSFNKTSGPFINTGLMLKYLGNNSTKFQF